MKSELITLTANQFSKFGLPARDIWRRCALVLVVASSVAAGTTSAHAQTFTTLYSFSGSDGNIPLAGVVHDPAGNVYGTTFYGGLGSGVVFKLDSGGNETSLHKFTCGTDGCLPAAPLIRDSAGNLYGTASVEGDPICQCGVVFKLDSTGKFTVLYSFKGGQDGAIPLAGLFRDSAGNLYGTTTQGGHGSGIVFKLDAAGKETVLYRFRGGTDGSVPSGGVVRDSAGNLYGMTSGGGHNNGTIFKLDATGKETVLYRFHGGADGSEPLGGVVRDSAGNLYGTTFIGGDLACADDGQGCGTVFKIDNKGTKTILHSFTSDTEGSDGAYPEGGLIRDSAGNLYGTTNAAGTIFEVNAAGEESILIFVDGSPAGGLFRDSAGNFYGTTSVGGDTFNPCGTVFEFTP